MSANAHYLDFSISVSDGILFFIIAHNEKPKSTIYYFYFSSAFSISHKLYNWHSKPILDMLISL
jgi:hypothetical protein